MRHRSMLALATSCVLACRPAVSVPQVEKPAAKPKEPAVLRSCAAGGDRKTVDFEASLPVSRTFVAVHAPAFVVSSQAYVVSAAIARSPATIEGSTYLVGEQKAEPSLAWLDESGSFRMRPLPFEPSAAASDGTKIWMIAPTHGRWASLDPRTSAWQDDPLHGLSPHDDLEVFAISGKLALMVTRAHGASLSVALYTVDTAQRRGLATTLDSKLVPIDAWCNEDDCVLVGRTEYGRCFVLAIDEYGRTTERELEHDRVTSASVVRSGSSYYAAWSRYDPDEIVVQTIDAHGVPRGLASRFLAPDGVTDVEGIAAHEGAYIAFRDHHQEWSRIAVLEGARLGAVQPIPMLRADSLRAIAIDDGVLAVGTSANVHVAGGMHPLVVFDSNVSVRFDPAPSFSTITTATSARRLVDAVGTGFAGYLAFPIAAPARAAVLVVPTGETPGSPVLFPVRAPCE